MNRELTGLKRECSESCYYGCRVQGFGINNERCTLCCDTDKCNNLYPNSQETGDEPPVQNQGVTPPTEEL